MFNKKRVIAALTVIALCAVLLGSCGLFDKTSDKNSTPAVSTSSEDSSGAQTSIESNGQNSTDESNTTNPNLADPDTATGDESGMDVEEELEVELDEGQGGGIM